MFDPHNLQLTNNGYSLGIEDEQGYHEVYKSWHQRHQPKAYTQTCHYGHAAMVQVFDPNELVQGKMRILADRSTVHPLSPREVIKVPVVKAELTEICESRLASRSKSRMWLGMGELSSSFLWG